MTLNVTRKKILSVIPRSIEAVGFNCYDSALGYAKVKGGMKYCIKGTYTSLTFKEFLDDEGINVSTLIDNTNQNGDTISNSYERFTPASDGYLIVTGGGGDVCINLVWTGWRNEDFETYSKYLRSIPWETYFPNGMHSIEDIYDSLEEDKATQRIGVASITGVTGDEITLINCDLTTTTYLCDGDGVGTLANGVLTLDKDVNNFTIYYVLAIPNITIISPKLNLTYTQSDFGTEEVVFDNGSIKIPAPCKILYVDNLRDKLRNIRALTTEELSECIATLY